MHTHFALGLETSPRIYHDNSEVVLQYHALDEYQESFRVRHTGRVYSAESYLTILNVNVESKAFSFRLEKSDYEFLDIEWGSIGVSVRKPLEYRANGIEFELISGGLTLLRLTPHNVSRKLVEVRLYPASVFAVWRSHLTSSEFRRLLEGTVISPTELQ